MRTRAAITLVAAVLAAPSLAGAAPPPAERAAPPAERVTPVRAAYPGKPTGPIAVDYRLGAPPAVGTPLEIEITARVQAAVSDLAIEASPSAPRSLLVTPPTFVAAGEGVYSWRITVVPLTTDAGYLSVVVAGTVDGLPQARSVTVPLRSAAAPEAASAAGDSSGEALIALPVQESP
jgi:hypothetical protein